MRYIKKIFNKLLSLKKRIQWYFNGVKIAKGTQIKNDVRIGRYTRINAKSYIDSCTIGNFVACRGRLVVRASNHYTNFANMQDWTQKYIIKSDVKVVGKQKKIKIGSASWIGDSVIILPGAQIGEGAVIGAGSIVTKSIPPFAIAVGSPAKVIKYRFPNPCIKFFLEIKWWDWSIEKIKNNKFFFEIDFSKVDMEELNNIRSKLV